MDTARVDWRLISPIAFMSDNHIEPDMGVEIFVLEPSSSDGRALTSARATWTRDPNVSSSVVTHPRAAAAERGGGHRSEVHPAAHARSMPRGPGGTAASVVMSLN